MPGPFPGMDPHLEAHGVDVHSSLALYARNQLQPQLPGGLRARVEEHIALDLDEVAIDLQTLVDEAYADGGYGGDIDSVGDPAPPLGRDDAAWADALLREKGLRG